MITFKIHPIILMMAVLMFASCDAHIETPDETVRPGHVLCDDGKALPYDQFELSGKRAVAVVFDTGQHGETEGNGYAVYLWDITPEAFADSLGVWLKEPRPIRRLLTGTRIPLPYMTHRKQAPRWRKQSSTYGITDKAPIFLRWHRCVCCTQHGRPLIPSSKNAVATLCRIRIPKTAGTGHRQKWKDSRPPKHGSTHWAAVPYKRPPKYRRTGCVPLLH